MIDRPLHSYISPILFLIFTGVVKMCEMGSGVADGLLADATARRIGSCSAAFTS